MFSLALLLGAAGTLSANTVDPLIVRTQADAEGIQLLLANLEGVKTTVQLHSLDSEELLLQKQVRKHNGFSYDIDLSELDHGRYILEVAKGDIVRKQVILISEAGTFLSQIK